MIVCDVAEKELDTELFAQHAIVDLNLWHYIYCFAHSGKTLTVKRNKHTHVRLCAEPAYFLRGFDKQACLSA